MLLFSDWRDFDERPGVYEIHFPNGLFYIGKSKNVRKRASEHTARLRRNAHNNPRMQAAFNKYKKVFFNIIQYCESDEEAMRIELRHIAAHKGNKKCANVSSGDWVKNADYVKYFSKPTLWVYLPTGLTYRTQSKNEWGNIFGLTNRWDKQKKIAVAMSRQHAMELHLNYWQDWLRQEAAKLERAQVQDRKKKEKSIKTWWYHMRNKNTGRAALARDTYEWKRFKPCEGWEWRRYGEQWPEAKQITPPKAVIGRHPVLGKKQWPSIGACARSLNRSHVSVFKALRGTRRTCAGWILNLLEL